MYDYDARLQNYAGRCCRDQKLRGTEEWEQCDADVTLDWIEYGAHNKKGLSYSFTLEHLSKTK